MGRVLKNGYHGPENHKRQRWLCKPDDGSTPHEFGEELPRQMTHTGFCLECERDYRAHEGPQSARGYHFTIRDITAALARVGAGGTYREAGFMVRARAERWKAFRGKRQRGSAHGQVVSDWVELFAPVVFAPHAPSAWPTVGSVLLDETNFRLNGGAGGQGGIAAYSVLTAMGYDQASKKMQLLMWRAYPDTHRAQRRDQWVEFLRSLPGQPSRIVCDRGTQMVRAIYQVWPGVHVHHCEYHLKQNARTALSESGITSGPAWDVVEHAFESLSEWNHLKTEWNATPHNKKLLSFIRRADALVTFQVGLRGTPTTMDPMSVSPLEERQRWLSKMLEGRSGRMTNRERFNRLLLLMQLHSNGQASELAYSSAIHEFLMANDGRPTTARRSIQDVKGRPSLRP